jgi:hypothetical protein
MTEESEHYMDRLMVHKSHVKSLDPEHDTQDNILQNLGHPEQSPRPTLPKQSTSRDFS